MVRWKRVKPGMYNGFLDDGTLALRVMRDDFIWVPYYFDNGWRAIKRAGYEHLASAKLEAEHYFTERG